MRIRVAELTLVVILLMSFTVILARAAPSQPHNADAMWVEPSPLSFNTNTTSVGFKFNVTVAMNFTEDVAAWQVVLYYNATQLNCTGVGATAAPQSEFMTGHATEFVGAINTRVYPPVNGSLQSVLAFETCSGPDFVPGPHSGTLFWAEFQIKLAPSSGQTSGSQFDISTEYEYTNTYVWNSNTDPYTFTPYDGTYQYTASPIDLAVLNVTSYKTVVFRGYSMNVSVTVANQGDSIETFNLTTYANLTAYSNTTMMTSQNITLPPGNSTTITFTWNTTALALGNYTISAFAWPVPGETNTINNNFTDGWVIVSMVGDLTGGTLNPWDFVPDGKVDGKDIAIVAACFGSAPGCPPPYRWNPNSDVNNGASSRIPDGRVDGADIATVAANFGQ